MSNSTDYQIKKTKTAIDETLKLILKNQNPLLSIISGTSSFSNNLQYDSLYSNATEDMATYHKEFNNPKSFLTIGASGEQVINAINSGAKYVDFYDSNLLCQYSVSLKIAAIKALSYEDYFKFYETFDYFLFQKIVPYLDEEAKYYWTNLYQILGAISPNPSSILTNLLFVYKKLDKQLIIKINPYLNPHNYEKLKKIISSIKVNFIPSDLYNLPKHINNKKYDVINCSNIYEYINYSPNVTLKKAQIYRDFIIDKLYPHLNSNGTILVSYLYAWSRKLKDDFDKMYQETNGYVVKTGAISLEEYYYYLNGLTTQNLAYSYLLDAFHNDPIEEIPTNHVQFGQSKDMSHDLALILRKK